jgi:thioredoxin-dependent peroxiredoxin
MARKSSKKSAAKSTSRPSAAGKRESSAPSSGKASPKTVKKSAKPVASANAATLNEGDRAPDFTLQRDGESTVRLADYKGRKLVIFFYPRADTPGCTTEAMAFTHLAKQFEAADTGVLGVSGDTVRQQTKFRDKHALAVPLGADVELDTIKAYGVWGEKSMYGRAFMGIIRTTVLVGKDGRVARIWRNVRVDGHAEEVLEAAKSL